MITSVYPVLMSQDLGKSSEFYQKYLGFKLTFASEWYVSLVDDGGHELAIIDCEHETIPADQRQTAQGIILNIEVADATDYYEKLSQSDQIEVVLPIRDEDFGQRHFMIVEPNGLLVDVIQVIPPTAEFLAQYQDVSNETK